MRFHSSLNILENKIKNEKNGEMKSFNSLKK